MTRFIRFHFLTSMLLLLATSRLGAQNLPRTVNVCSGGDLVLGTNLDTAWAQRATARLGRPVPALPDPLELIAPLRQLVSGADIVLLNVEGAVGEGPVPPKCRRGSRSCYAFRQQIEAASAIRTVSENAVVGNLANNHAMDAGVAGFGETRRHLEEAGIHVTGVDTLPTFVPLPWGDTVAFLGFSTAQAGPDPRHLDAAVRHIRGVADRFANVVVTMHMGAEGVRAQRTRDSTEMYLGENRGNVVRFARAAVDAGAALVVGHGPHVLRAMEWREESLIAYSLGNLLTYGPFSMAEPLNRGAMLCAILDGKGGVAEATIRATHQRLPGIIAPDPNARAVWLVDSLSQLDFPTTGAQFIIQGLTTRRK